MDIFFNGYKLKLNKNLTLNELILYFDLNETLIVIEVNKKIVPNTFWVKYNIHNYDHIEILSVVGGG